MTITYKILNPSTGLYSNSHVSSINEVAKLQAIEFFKNNNLTLMYKVYTTEDNIEIVKPYENYLY